MEEAENKSIKILVTGSNGQLGRCLQAVSPRNPNYEFHFKSSTELDITDKIQISKIFELEQFNYCVNCAAYTAVDNAELNKEVAKRVNVLGARNLALACETSGTVLIHVSTDFVFDGMQTIPYDEEVKANPLSVYGLTKLDGEISIADVLKEHIIIRTSWLYSEHGQNFLKTMLKLGSERDSLGVVSDQIGTPTYAGDLASTIYTIITKEKSNYGTYHYSNEGVASWYDFAKAIFDIRDINVTLLPIKTEAYPTPAVRPRYSVMDKSKIKEELKSDIPYWRDSLEVCLKRLEE